MTGDPLVVMKRRLQDLKPSFSWNPSDPTWMQKARAAVIDAIGVVNLPWDDSQLQCYSETQEQDHTRIRVEFPSHEGWLGRGWLLIPHHLEGPRPAVVCLPGHGKGADSIVGLVEESYQANFALQCVSKGWITLAVEQVSFGSNQSRCDRDLGSSCVVDSMAALLLGETITGWRVRDAIAACRTLACHPLVQSSKIGVMGISGGGLTALWSAALEPAFLAAGVSGYFCPMSHSILNVYHCPDNYVPGFARLMDVPDLAGLIADRWLAVEGGTHDPLFRATGFESACKLARKIFDFHGAPERLCTDLFEGDHVFNGQRMLQHFDTAFRWKG